MSARQVWRLVATVLFALGSGFGAVGLGNDVTFTRICLALGMASLMLFAFSLSVVEVKR